MTARFVSPRWKGTVGVSAAAAALMVMALPMSGVAAQTPPSGYASYNFSGYSTGTAQHVGAIQAGITGPQLANAEVAFSGASVASQGTGGVTQGPGAKAGTIVNEMSQVVQPTLPGTGKLAGDRSYGRGSGLEVGLGNNLPNPANQIPVNKVEVSAPPNATDSATVGPVPASPLAYADLLKGQAAANFNTAQCTLGTPLSQGIGYAANAQVLETGTSAPTGTLTQPVLATNGPTNTNQNVNQSLSQTLLVPQTKADGSNAGPNLGLRSETRQILAPVTFFKGTTNEFTIQLAGEWVLQAVAGGVPGSAYVHYGPGTATPNTPVLTVIQNGVVNQIITTQQLLGKTGLTIPIPSVANIVIGEAPRAIGSDNAATPGAPVVAANGTSASAAVDVVRVQLLQQKNAAGAVTFQGADVRVGHMESSATVPVNGITCPIPVTKSADPANGPSGSTFTYKIHIDNPYDCTLNPVDVKDQISTDSGSATASVTGTSPQADTQSDTAIEWKNVGPIAPGGSKDLTITFTGNGAGVLKDHIDVSATCGNGSAAGSNQITVPLTGTFTVSSPSIGGPGAGNVKAPAEQLPRTGGPSWPLAAGGGALVALLGLVGIRRRLFS